MRALLATERYYPGDSTMPTVFQIHPLNLALALAADTERRGGAGPRSHRGAVPRAPRHGWQLATAMGEITARHVVLAGNADLGRIHPRIARARSCRWRPTWR